MKLSGATVHRSYVGGGTPKTPISRRERVTFQRSSSFSWESIPGWTFRRLCPNGSQPLTSLDLADSKMPTQFSRQPPV
ncbi:hypothetical protein TNCV_3446651 [Trichonephila clavipes]|nr:hypothetical protein TNCV_3446651 [Trichonephila clavipes]